MVFCTDPVKTLSPVSHEAMQKLVLDEIDRYLVSYGHHIPGEQYILFDVATLGHAKAWVRTVDGEGSISSRRELDFRENR
jgi:hypothetical protein